MAHGLEITGVPVANEEDIQDPDMIQTSISLVPSFGAPAGDATRFRVVFRTSQSEQFLASPWWDSDVS